jgi:serine/threonine-protein kinase
MSAGQSSQLAAGSGAGLAGAKMLGRYQLCDCIGRGGMAQVHLGRLLGPVGFSRTVAIKRLHPHLAGDPEFVSMFVDEARLASRIRHPNVMPILDVAAEDNELFLVMEYVPGESLASLLKAATCAGARVPVPVAVAIVVHVLQGLQAAHEATDAGQPLPIIHRDVSPQNVLVGADGVARLLDFGIAKARGRLHYTREGVVKGKPRYMSPEQISGQELAPATDIFAASVVLWECLTGQRLFVGDSDEQIRREVLAGSYRPTSAAAGDIEPELDAVVMKGLACDPQDRHPSAHAMAVELMRHSQVASSMEVSAWVKSLAAETLAHRAAVVAAIEAASGAGELPEQAIATRKVTVPPPSDAHSTGSSIALSVVAPRHGRRFGYAVAGTVAACVLFIGAFVLARFQLGSTAHEVTVSVIPPEPRSANAPPPAATLERTRPEATASPPATEDAGARAQPRAAAATPTRPPTFEASSGSRPVTRAPKPTPTGPTTSTTPTTSAIPVKRSPDGLFERN